MLHLKKKQKSTHNVYVSVALKKGVRIFLRKTWNRENIRNIKYKSKHQLYNDRID